MMKTMKQQLLQQQLNTDDVTMSRNNQQWSKNISQCQKLPKLTMTTKQQHEHDDNDDDDDDNNDETTTRQQQ